MFPNFAKARPISSAYLVGVYQGDLRTLEYPTYQTDHVFSFFDAGRAGKVLAALCSANTVSEGLVAVLSSGCVPANSPGDVSLAGACMPGDMWACVCWDAYWPVGRPPKARTPTYVVHGFYDDLMKPCAELTKLTADEAVALSDSFFTLGNLSRMG